MTTASDLLGAAAGALPATPGCYGLAPAITWLGPGARPAGGDDARLLGWTIELPTGSDVAAVAANLTGHGFTPRRDGDDLLADDPWGSTVRGRVA